VLAKLTKTQRATIASMKEMLKNLLEQ